MGSRRRRRTTSASDNLDDLTPVAIGVPGRAAAGAVQLRPVLQGPGPGPGLGPTRPGAACHAARRLHHPAPAGRRTEGDLGADEPQPDHVGAARAALQLPGAARGGVDPGLAGGRQPGRGGAHRRLSDHQHPRLQAPAGRPQPGEDLGQRPGDKNVHNGALVAIDSATGEIVSYVGSVDYYDRKDPRVQGQFDVAGLGLRQPGSAFKPIVYSSAFRAREATPGTFFVDSVTQFGADREYQLPAHQRRYQGPRSAAGGRRAALLAQRPVGDDAVPGRDQRDGTLRAVDGDRVEQVHPRPGSGPVAGPRFGARQPDQHDRRLRRLRPAGHAPSSDVHPGDPRPQQSGDLLPEEGRA